MLGMRYHHLEEQSSKSTDDNDATHNSIQSTSQSSMSRSSQQSSMTSVVPFNLPRRLLQFKKAKSLSNLLTTSTKTCSSRPPTMTSIKTPKTPKPAPAKISTFKNAVRLHVGSTIAPSSFLEHLNLSRATTATSRDGRLLQAAFEIAAHCPAGENALDARGDCKRYDVQVLCNGQDRFYVFAMWHNPARRLGEYKIQGR
ncbi:hypothetical protein LEN26_002825 [Aphanomyces euteiches]|nr:hypothetical protein AeMF1_019941 [Aphanomyces euteiches]KAH9158661.1 hypothetical protein LEN26_002825 [Aphanomyces euteiches]